MVKVTKVQYDNIEVEYLILKQAARHTQEAKNVL